MIECLKTMFQQEEYRELFIRFLFSKGENVSSIRSTTVTIQSLRLFAGLDGCSV